MAMEYHIIAGASGRKLATVRFHGETVDAAGEAEIVAGTEPTIERLLEILKGSLPYSKAMSSQQKPASEEPKEPGSVTSLDQFRRSRKTEK